jgi:outer membrane protein assembly factor BamB
MPRIAVLVVFSFIATTLVFADDWPTWRGPHGNGHSSETNLPVKWDAKSIVWKTALPGIGQSSPVVKGDRIFLTSYLDKGKKRVLLCVERATGKILWQQEAWSGVPEKTHQMNGWASATCATDGEHVFAFFGKGGLHCYTADGKKVWSRDLGQFSGDWGTTASPLLFGDLVVQNCDSTAKPFLLAVDKHTGKDVWKTPRPTPQKGGWSSPILVNTGQRPEIVLNGEAFVIGYDPKSGAELWRCKAFAGRGEPTIAPDKNRVFVVNGLAGDIYSVKIGGAGDVTKSNILWHTPRKGNRDQPSPIVVGDYLLVADMKGVTTCYDANTGKIWWKERIGAGEFTASPVAANGLAYFLSEQGDTIVLEPAREMKKVSTNPLSASGELFRATLTPSNGQFFARSQTHLYCIGNGKK